jgi:hypothetical protein
MTGNWLPRILWWFVYELKELWFTLLPFVIGIIFCWLIPAGIFNGPILCDTLETRIRLTGLFLEVLGICTVVYGINQNLKLFVADNLWKRIQKRFERFPKLVENHRVIEGLLSCATASDSASAFITCGPGPNSSLEYRITRLEEQFNQVSLQVHEYKIYTEKEFKKLSEALDAERRKREAMDNQIRYELKESAVGDFSTELMGIVWLIFGAISATAATELANYWHF